MGMWRNFRACLSCVELCLACLTNKQFKMMAIGARFFVFCLFIRWKWLVNGSVGEFSGVFELCLLCLSCVCCVWVVLDGLTNKTFQSNVGAQGDRTVVRRERSSCGCHGRQRCCYWHVALKSRLRVFLMLACINESRVSRVIVLASHKPGPWTTVCEREWLRGWVWTRSPPSFLSPGTNWTP